MGERFLPLNDFADEHRVLSVLAEGNLALSRDSKDRNCYRLMTYQRAQDARSTVYATLWINHAEERDNEKTNRPARLNATDVGCSRQRTWYVHLKNEEMLVRGRMAQIARSACNFSQLTLVQLEPVAIQTGVSRFRISAITLSPKVNS
jgi:hypothetical protein